MICLNTTLINVSGLNGDLREGMYKELEYRGKKILGSCYKIQRKLYISVQLIKDTEKNINVTQKNH